MDRVYACIDLKSFYASVECVERRLNPLTTNLVVADSSRTEKTICLAVSPSLKSYGIGGRARLFEVVQKVREINRERKKNIFGNFIGSSYDDNKIKKNNKLKLDYIVATPRMSYYIKYSTRIYDIYLKYLSSDDIYVYSIDEVFCDLTDYLDYYKLTPRELVTKIIKDVYDTTGITATGGIGTNLYLAKVAMDIVAKHMKANEYGVRIAGLDEKSYRKLLWGHRPITDFWRVGKGYANKLYKNNMFTMGDICRCSLNNEDLLYKLFGVNAELLIDHAWGYEPCKLSVVKSYKPINNSMSSGQVLHCSYNYEKTKLIVKEMTELLVLDLVDRKLVTDQIVLTIGYDADNKIDNSYDGEVSIDYYGRMIPKNGHGSINIDHWTSSSKILINKAMELFEKIINKKLKVRRIYVVFNNVINEDVSKSKINYEQMNLFANYKSLEEKRKRDSEYEFMEKKIQHTIIDIKNKFGRNAILKGMNLKDGGTTIDRNNQIGGHRA